MTVTEWGSPVSGSATPGVTREATGPYRRYVAGGLPRSVGSTMQLGVQLVNEFVDGDGEQVQAGR